MKKKCNTVANPTGQPRPVTIVDCHREEKNITDRAQRFRANAEAKKIKWGRGRPRCHYCGRPAHGERNGRNPTRLMIDHISGHEADNDPKNLTRSCRSCNNTKAAAFIKAGKGKRTRQYNPAAAGARSYGAYIKAVMTLKGYDTGMEFDAARELMRNTPHAKRSEYAREIWENARKKGGPLPGRRKSEEVPF